MQATSGERARTQTQTHTQTLSLVLSQVLASVLSWAVDVPWQGFGFSTLILGVYNLYAS